MFAAPNDTVLIVDGDRHNHRDCAQIASSAGIAISPQCRGIT
jgi:hypothetical protein